jgi:CRISPR-associated protein Csm3
MTFGHHVLRNRYRLEGDLELITGLRLSSGRASDESDAPLMRTRSGVPYIPGSSLRGAIRSELERMIPELGLGLRSCTLFLKDDSDGACLTASEKLHKELRDLSEQLGEGETHEDREAKAARFLEEHLCDLCKLFGSPLYASRLAIEDCLPATEQLLTTVRDGVGIDRDTGAARENVKFNYEVLETGRERPKFRLRVQAENLAETDWKLLDLVAFVLEEGFFVGGKRAAGLGRVRLVEGSLQVRGFDSVQALWQSITEKGDPYGEARPWKEVRRAQA